MFRNKLFIFILLAIFAKQFLWTVSVPVLHSPDEQSHFAQIQWIVEKNNLQLDLGQNRSLELRFLEEHLGTFRDGRGNNKFTYHPEYNIVYSKSTIGIFENQIQSTPKSYRTIYSGAEASGYPPFYYLLSKPFYQAVQDSGIIDRIYSLRLFSLFLIVLLAIATWKIGEEIFSTQIETAVLTLLVSFQPMISFVGAGYHPDNLLNVISSLSILFSVFIIKKGFRWRYFLALMALIFLGLETKQFMFFVAPPIFSLSAYAFFKSKSLKILTSVLILLLPIIAFVLLLPIPYMPTVSSSSPLYGMNFLEYLKFRIPRFLFEMHPWYWGVFKWLGVTLNPIVMKIITRVVALAIFGAILGLFIKFYKKKVELLDKIVIYFMISSFCYILYMFLWDWRLMQASGFSLGLQGRYLLPLILMHMTIIFYGLTNLFSKKLKKIIFCLVVVGIVALNLTALLRVITSYYQVASLDSLITQMSQYKPMFIKGVPLEMMLLVSGFFIFVSLFFFIKNICFYKDK